jgi:hypothetical protein
MTVGGLLTRVWLLRCLTTIVVQTWVVQEPQYKYNPQGTFEGYGVGPHDHYGSKGISMRLVRWILTGLCAGLVTGFLIGLLRNKTAKTSHTSYAPPTPAASRSAVKASNSTTQ